MIYFCSLQIYFIMTHSLIASKKQYKATSLEIGHTIN